MLTSTRQKLAHRDANFAGVMLLCASLLFAASCRKATEENPSNQTSKAGTTQVHSPAAGEVHRLLVKTGETVYEGAPLLEILIPFEGPTTTSAPTPAPLTDKKPGLGVQSIDKEIEAQRAEVVRAESDVQRLTPLVAAGQASQGELDGARERYERAQQRFQQAQKNRQTAQDTLVAGRQASALKSANQKSGRLITVRAAGTGKILSLDVEEGEAVSEGQTLATVGSSVQ